MSGLPTEISNNGSDVFGAYASTFWLDAYGPALQGQQWTWPDPTDVPNPVQLPDLAGVSKDSALATLTQLGLTGTVASTVCGSGQPAGTVGYYEPHLASAGGKVTLCLSSGTAPTGSSSGGYSTVGRRALAPRTPVVRAAAVAAGAATGAVVTAAVVVTAAAARDRPAQPRTVPAPGLAGEPVARRRRPAGRARYPGS